MSKIPFTGVIKILDEKELWKFEVPNSSIYFRIILRTVEKQKIDGTMDKPRKFIVFDRGNSVCALILVRGKPNKFILVRQYRGGSNSYDWELPAGMRDGNEDAMKAVQREVMEETGFQGGLIFKSLKLKLSPGAASERSDVFYVETSMEARTGKGGGRIEEWEDIEVAFVPVKEAIQMVLRGEITSATAVAAILWYAAEYSKI